MGDAASAEQIYRAGLALAEEDGLGVERGRFLIGQAKVAL
jgi:hypothetical protein